MFMQFMGHLGTKMYRMFKVIKLFAMYDSWIAGRILLIKLKKKLHLIRIIIIRIIILKIFSEQLDCSTVCIFQRFAWNSVFSLIIWHFYISHDLLNRSSIIYHKSQFVLVSTEKFFLDKFLPFRFILLKNKWNKSLPTGSISLVHKDTKWHKNR